jgi:hypothetical protein
MSSPIYLIRNGEIDRPRFGPFWVRPIWKHFAISGGQLPVIKGYSPHDIST